jgi:nucleoside-triphosphatase THEP1
VRVDLYVLHALMLHGIGREVDRADVVAVDEGGTLEGAMELLEKLAHLGGLYHAGAHSGRRG